MSSSDSDDLPISQTLVSDGSESEEMDVELVNSSEEDSAVIVSDDSDDEGSKKKTTKAKPRAPRNTKTKKEEGPKKRAAGKRAVKKEEDSEDDMADFLEDDAKPAKKRGRGRKAARDMEIEDDDDDDEEDAFEEDEEEEERKKPKRTRAKAAPKPRAKAAPAKRKTKKVKEEDEFDDNDDDDDDDVIDSDEKPIGSKRRSTKRAHEEEDIEVKVENQLQKAKSATKKAKVLTPVQLFDRAVQSFKWWEHRRRDKDIYWTTLQHNGVIFQPPYTPHNVPLYYDGKPVKMTPEQEEIATLYAMVGDNAIQLREEESAAIFNGNFFEYFRAEMGEDSVVKSLDKCDFTAIRQYLEERKKSTVKASAEEKQQMQMRMGYVIIDGNVQKTGNFVVEPPSLFRGRGLHPKMGSVKMRVIPEQVTLNVDLDMAIPACPMPGHNWETMVSRPETSWMVHWMDNVQGMGKYMNVNATSFLKGQHDEEKYEVARKLKKCIGDIRKSVLINLKSTSMRERQLATAIWIIDKLALRVGNDKDEDEADTVGCCSLRVEHLAFNDPYMLTMDFLAKDSMRYHQEIRLSRYEGGKQVFKNLRRFCAEKTPEEEVFHLLTTTLLNQKLDGYMKGLTAKVFRTFNASVTLERQLHPTYPEGTSIEEMVMQYNAANREVAILCNHQRTLPKNWDENRDKKKQQLDTVQRQVDELKEMLERVRAGKKVALMPEKYQQPLPKLEIPEGTSPEETERLKQVYREERAERSMYSHMYKSQPSEDQVEKRLKTFEARLASMTLKLKDLDANKSVALGTSKINYMDPRITVAWCKRNQVPIEKIFTTALRNKHNWAMCVPESYRF